MASPPKFVLGQLVEVSRSDGSWSLGNIMAIDENMVTIHGSFGSKGIPKDALATHVRTAKGFTKHMGFIADGGDTRGMRAMAEFAFCVPSSGSWLWLQALAYALIQSSSNKNGYVLEDEVAPAGTPTRKTGLLQTANNINGVFFGVQKGPVGTTLLTQD